MTGIQGGQEGRHDHGHYREYCYLPLDLFCGDFPVTARLRTSESGQQQDTIRLIRRITGALRTRFGRRPQILWRGDGGFCRRERIECREALGVDYVSGMRFNPLLERILREALRSTRSMQPFNQSRRNGRSRVFIINPGIGPTPSDAWGARPNGSDAEPIRVS